MKVVLELAGNIEVSFDHKTKILVLDIPYDETDRMPIIGEFTSENGKRIRLATYTKDTALHGGYMLCPYGDMHDEDRD